MNSPFILAPRYRLDDNDSWLKGIDPSRHYWIHINGDLATKEAIAGLTVMSIPEWKQKIRQFRQLHPSEALTIQRAASECKIHCISDNCYAVEAEVKGAAVWHLFDAETLESLLRTSHPDWQAAPQDIDLGRQQLFSAFEQPAVATK